MTLTITQCDITNAETDAIFLFPTGDAVITPSFGLQAAHIIHAAGPIWAGRRGHNLAAPLTDRGLKQVDELVAEQICQNESGDLDVALIAYPGIQIEALRNK